MFHRFSKMFKLQLVLLIKMPYQSNISKVLNSIVICTMFNAFFGSEFFEVCLTILYVCVCVCVCEKENSRRLLEVNFFRTTSR